MKDTDLQKVRDQLAIQGLDGNWDYDWYMCGMYNGLECALATMEDREPRYRTLPRRPWWKFWK